MYYKNILCIAIHKTRYFPKKYIFAKSIFSESNINIIYVKVTLFLAFSLFTKLKIQL